MHSLSELELTIVGYQAIAERQQHNASSVHRRLNDRSREWVRGARVKKPKSPTLFSDHNPQVLVPTMNIHSPSSETPLAIEQNHMIEFFQVLGQS